MDEKITVEKCAVASVSEEEWNGLLLKSGFKSIFQTHQWNETWWNHFCKEGEPFVLRCWAGDALIGIMPFIRMEWKPFSLGPSFKVIKFIGAPDSDYTDFIIHKDRYDIVLNACLSWLASNKKTWNIITLRDVSENSPTSTALNESLEKHGLVVSCHDRSICPQAILPSSYSDYEQSLGRTTRNVTRRKKRRLAREGVFDFETGSSLDMGDFFRLYSCRWGEMSKLHQQFHLEVARKLEEYLNLTFVTLDGIRIAVQYSYDFDNARSLYLAGFDTRYQHLSPGVVSLLLCIEDAIDKKLSLYDFMRGDEPYKFRYSNRVSKNHEYVISHSLVRLITYLAVKNISDQTRFFFRFKQWRKLYPKNIYLKMRKKTGSGNTH